MVKSNKRNRKRLFSSSKKKQSSKRVSHKPKEHDVCSSNECFTSQNKSLRLKNPRNKKLRIFKQFSDMRLQMKLEDEIPMHLRLPSVTNGQLEYPIPSRHNPRNVDLNQSIANNVSHGRNLKQQVEQFKDNPAQFCLHWSNFNDRLDTHEIRRLIIEESLGDDSAHFSQVNFPVSELTQKRIKTVYQLIDKYFWNNTMDEALQKVAKDRGFLKGFHFIIHTEKPEKDVAKASAFLDVQIAEDPTQTHLNDINITFQTRKWGVEACHRQVDEIPSPHKLHAFILAFCHELCHAITWLKCFDSEHSETFLKLNNHMFGHSLRKYTAVDYI
jgi:hypothetical protein